MLSYNVLLPLKNNKTLIQFRSYLIILYLHFSCLQTGSLLPLLRKKKRNNRVVLQKLQIVKNCFDSFIKCMSLAVSLEKKDSLFQS